jgi:hypothetical protein
MSMPGFTAEVSLAKTNQHYLLASTAAVKAGRVLPQASFNTTRTANAVPPYTTIYVDGVPIGIPYLGYFGLI